MVKQSLEATANVEQLAAFAESVAAAKDETDIFQAAAHAADNLIGHSLFTVMSFDADAMEVERRFTSDPAHYPAGGRKKKRDTDWGQHVLVEGHVFIGTNEDDIRRNFNDHEVIIGLGLCSVLNIPIKRMGRTIGTMNLLDTTAHYGTDDVVIGSILAMGLAIAIS